MDKQNITFVPYYCVIINFFDSDNVLFRSKIIYFDYFKKDIYGVPMFVRLRDEWSIPYSKTSIVFHRVDSLSFL